MLSCCCDCAYQSQCLKWATQSCLDYRPQRLPPPLVVPTGPQRAEHRVGPKSIAALSSTLPRNACQPIRRPA